MFNSGIYEILNTATDKSYIGSSRNLKDRFITHQFELKKNVHANRKLQNAWNKYGEASFKFIVIEYVKIEKLLTREQYWITVLDVVKNGYNISPSATNSLGVRHTPEARMNMSIAHIGKIASAETRQKMSDSRKGKPAHPNAKAALLKSRIGAVASDETRRKISESSKGRKMSFENKLKVSLVHTGRKITEETRKKMSIASSGRIPSIEARKKISESVKATIARKKANARHS